MTSELIDRNDTNKQERARILTEFGANARETEELLAYNRNVFEGDNFKASLQFPLPSEPHIAVWQEYVTEAETRGTFATLKDALIQLRFPIETGISQSEAYLAATRKGIIPNETGLLQQPQIQLTIHHSLAGAIPVLLTKNREDFVTLVRAITKRNEPVAIPDSMGACMVAGYNNWDRIRRYRQQWLAARQQETENRQQGQEGYEFDLKDSSELAWSAEFKRLIARKELYQDRFIILSDGFYSNVKPEELGLTADEWRSVSLTIRLEHECTHYFTRRVFNSMRNNLLDELIADYRGIVAATGEYKADWFLRFLGLESFPYYREGGRLQNYRGQPPLSDGAFKILQRLVKVAAENLEDFDRNYGYQLRTRDNPIMLMALTCLTIEELASSQAGDRLQQIIEQLQSNIKSG